MAIDLGPIQITLNADTTGFDRGIDQAEARVDGLLKSTDRASKAKLDVSPTGGRELDSASKSADGLSKGLDRAGQSANKVKAPTGVGRELDSASKSASGLAGGLDQAAGAASRVKAPTGVAKSLDSASSSAGSLANELAQATSEAQQLGSAGGGVSRFDGALTGLASTARGLVPALSGAAAVGATLTKGWGRLTSIDNAQFKLQGLGHTTESTADIMNSAMDSVTGTAYGFGDAASLAASTVAATGASGDELTQILSSMADAAAISGRSLGDMGMIFNQVAASGTLMGDDLNQLLDSGIPILNLLADELGVTAAEVKDLASEGEVSFAQFESAMRSGMGGAAQEMGQSVTGALGNVGAAVGRLGAEVMSGGFAAMPDVLGGITDGVDLLTDGVSAAVDAWEGLPAPVKAVAGGFVAAKGATALLNTELGGRLINTVMDLKDQFGGGLDNIRSFGSHLGEAYRYAGQANPELGALGRTMSVVGGQGGVASVAMDGMKNSASGLLTALGGPWGLAMAGATAAVGLYMNHVQQVKQEQEEAAAATQKWSDVLVESDGKITDSVQQHALLAVEQAEVSDQLEQLGISQAEAAAATLDLDGAYGDLIGSLDRIIDQGSSMEGDARIGQKMVRSEDAEVAMELKAALEQLADQREQGAAQANEAANAEDELARAVADAAGAADASIPKFSQTNSVLEQMGVDADTADDAIQNLAAAMMGIDPDPLVRLQGYLADSASTVQDFGDSLADGMGGFDIDTGLFDVWDEQGQKLAGTMDGLQNSIHMAAAAQYEASREMGMSGVDAAREAAETAAEYTEELRRQAGAAGWSEGAIDQLIDTYNLTPEEILTRITTEGLEIATSLSSSLNEDLARVNAEDYTIVVDSEGLRMTEEQAEKLGFTLEEVGGLTTLTADTEQARNALEEYATYYEGLADNTVVFRADVEELTGAFAAVEDTSARWTNEPVELGVVADTKEARDAIDELGAKSTDLEDGYLYIGDNSDEVMNNILGLGAETAALPEGSIVIDSNSEELLEILDIAGFKVTTLPNGELLVNHDDIHNAIRAMEEAGALVRDGASGELSVNNNFPANKQAMGELAALVAAGAQGDAIMSHNANTVRDQIISALSGLETFGTHHVNQVTRITNANAELAGALNMPHHPLLNAGGRLPGYAAGDRHGGYRIPGSGPGTETTDGFLALDRFGQPVARLDADEWVINGDSSEAFDPVLAALNANNPTAALAALMNSLPGHAEGRSPSGDATPQDMPNVEMSADAEVTLTAEGVADELSIIGQRLEMLGQGETVTVDAVSDQAMTVLNAVDVETRALPDGSVEIDAAGDGALDTLAGVSDMLFEVGDQVVDPEVFLDTTELVGSAQNAQEILSALDIENPTPYASIIIDDLLSGKDIAQGELNFLASMVPTPATDLNNALLNTGVAVAESELQRVGNSKATSVVDVNNASAIANVNATLAALDKMPVERTIRIVAAGSAASAIGSYNMGGRIPKLATGGRLPTTGPGTDTTDGILGVGSDGVPTAMVDAGEWVVTKDRSQAFDRTLGAINSGTPADIANAIKSDLPGIQQLKKGGVVSPEQLLDFAGGAPVMGQQAQRSLQGAIYDWGGVNWGDCSGAMAGLANFAVGLSAFGSRFATMNQREATAALGFMPGLGDPATSFNLGWFNGGPWGGHTAGDIGGTAVEMGGGAGGNGKIGGAAASASHPQFTDHAHLTLGELWAFDRFSSLPKVTSRYQPAPDPTYVTEGGNGVGDGGLGLQIASALGGGVSHTGGDGIHMNNGTVVPFDGGRLYDVGGLWPKGTWGFNNIGDEMVLPPRETEQFKALPEAAAAMHATADAVGSLHPELRRMVDQTMPQMEQALSLLDEGVGQLELMADPDSVEGITARATADRVLGFDLLPYTSEMRGMLDAEAALTAARMEQAERTQAIADSEQALLDARNELEELRNSDTTMSVSDQRKLADAEKAVSEARADGDAEKVADAEQKLARAREDVAANSDEAAVKREEDIAKATEAVTESENDLVAARQEQVKALDHIILPDTLGELIPQIGAAAGALGGSLPQVATALTGLAATALPAGLTLGMALSAVQVALDVAREIYSIVDDLINSVLDARTAAAEGMAESMSAVREWTVLVDEQRQTVSRLRQAVVQAEVDMVAAQWNVRTAQLDVGRAQLQGVKSIADAEAALQAERDRQAKANWWQYNDLSLAYDRLRWAQHDAAYGQLEDYQTITPEIQALQHEVLAAQLAGAESVKNAQLSSLEAARSLENAQKSLDRGWRDLEIARARAERMSGTSFGMTAPESMVAQEVARLQAENAKLAGERDNLGTRVSDAFWNIFDMSGDGKFFGLIDVPGSQQRNTLDQAIAANQEAINRLMQSEYAPDWDDAQRAEAQRVIDRAAGYYAMGNDAAGDAAIQGSIWGDAQRALDENRVWDEISQWEQGRRELEDGIADLKDNLDFEEIAQPLREQAAALQAGSASAQYSADALREQNPMIREILEKMAVFESGAARDISAGRPIQNVTIVGDHFNADQMEEALRQLAGQGQDVDLRVSRLEQPDRPTGRDVMAARR